VVLLLVLGACEGDARPPGSARPSSLPAPAASLRIVAMTDLSGYLEPCGCQSRPLGGVDKAATVLKELAADRVPTVLLAAGNLFFEPGGSEHGAAEVEHEAEAKTQVLWQAEALAGVLKSFGLAAAVPGPADIRYGFEQLAQLRDRAGVALLGGSGRPASQLIERGAIKLGVWGASDALLEPGANAASELIKIAKAETAALRERGAHVVVGLINAEARVARRVAGSTDTLDFLLVAGADSTAAPPPERIGKTTLLHASKDGRGLLVVDVYRSPDAKLGAPLKDASTWTQGEQSRAANARAEELAARIADWKKTAGTDPKLIAEQEQRLAALRSEAKAASAAKTPSDDSFSARFIELGPEIKDDAELTALLSTHDKRVNEHNRVALASMKPIPVPAGTPGYVGSERCKECHAPAFEWWRGHAHGRAYETLVKVDKQFSLKCVSCHVTGYGKPGGAAVVHNQGLVDVGCESCHGPGSLHVQDRDTEEAKNVKLEVPETVCVHCHNEEHSDQFAYEKYKAELMAPGHGEPVKPAGATP
jgi:hypothetical protein